MKKRLSILSAVLVIVVLLSSAAPAVALDLDKFEEKQVTTYLLNMDDKTTVTLLFNRDLPEVPYINILDFFRVVYVGDLKLTRTGDHEYTLSKSELDMKIDVENDVVFIENSETFICDGIYYPEDSILGGDYICYEDDETIGSSPLILDLGSYGFDVIEKNGSVYFPVCILNDMVHMTYKAAEYVGGCLYFTETYYTPDGFFDRSPIYETTERSKALAEYTYNELCFQFDNYYGCPSKAPIAPYVEELGFDKALDTYSDETRLARQLLKSTSRVDFNLGLILISEAFYDGGHTLISWDFYDEMYNDSKLYKAIKEKFDNSSEDNWVLARKIYDHCYNDPDLVPRLIYATKQKYTEKYEKALEWEDIAYLVICGDTAVFSFDSFDDAVLPPFCQSLEYAKKQGVKNFVIDITLNGGGVTTVYAYIIAMMTNKNTHGAYMYERELYRNTKNISLSKRRADLNFDGKYDELDGEIIYDFNYAILTSSFSFSSANSLACLAKENGIMIIGEKSNGGSCFVDNFYTPSCEIISASMLVKSIYENGEDHDLGAEVDVDLRKPYTGSFDPELYGTDDPAEVGLYDYDGFYDFEALGKYIDEFYDKGDINGDGFKNNKDVISLFKYVSSSLGAEYIAKYDINSNGKINNKDVVALFAAVSEA